MPFAWLGLVEKLYDTGRSSGKGSNEVPYGNLFSAPGFPRVYAGLWQNAEQAGRTPSFEVEDNFNLRFNSAPLAMGSQTMAGNPSRKNALNAIAAAGGSSYICASGSLRYKHAGPERFHRSGRFAHSLGVESLTPVPPPNAPGAVLTRGLDLTSGCPVPAHRVWPLRLLVCKVS